MSLDIAKCWRVLFIGAVIQYAPSTIVLRATPTPPNGAPGQFGCFRPVNLKGRPKATAALYAGPELAGGLQVALSNVTMKLTTTTRDIRRPRGRPSSGKALYRGPRPWGS